MAVHEHTFVFEDDKVYLMAHGKVVAAADDVDELEEQLEDEDSEETQEEKAKKATHIITPSGLKGKIVSRTEGLWSDEVAVRLENGNIAHYHVLADTQFITEEETPAVNPIQRLEEELHVDYDESREALEARKQQLASINRQARDLIQKGASYDDTARLDKISLLAEDELENVNDALGRQDELDAERFEVPAPFRTEVVEQESFNGNRGEWLDHTLNEMIEEANGFDYQKFMDEGPEELVGGIDDVPLADQGAVQQIAAGVVREKTAAADPAIRDKYEKTFLARVEQVRREELKNRKEATKKEAAVTKEAHDDAPDESLFL